MMVKNYSKFLNGVYIPNSLSTPKGVGKSKLDAFKPEIESLLANGSTQKFVAKRYKTTEANLHNWLKKNNLMTAQQRNGT